MSWDVYMILSFLIFNLKYSLYMNKEKNIGLRFCGECINKIKDPNLPDGTFRCQLIVDIIHSGIVHSDTDATACVNNHRFKCHL